MTESTDHMEDALRSIKRWCEAYPLEVFPEPDKAAIRALIGDDRMAALHASWARQILTGIARYVREGLGEP